MTKANVPPEWVTEAPCGTVDPEIWFPTPSNPTTAIARAICGTCPQAVACLTYALADPTLEGVWGGTTPRERSRLRGPRVASPAAAPRPAAASRAPGRAWRPQDDHGTPRGLAMHRRLGTKPCRACAATADAAA